MLLSHSLFIICGSLLQIWKPCSASHVKMRHKRASAFHPSPDMSKSSSSHHDNGGDVALWIFEGSTEKHGRPAPRYPSHYARSATDMEVCRTNGAWQARWQTMQVSLCGTFAPTMNIGGILVRVDSNGVERTPLSMITPTSHMHLLPCSSFGSCALSTARQGPVLPFFSS